MHLNGMIIQKYADNPYKGIDGSGFSDNSGANWYFNDMDEVSQQFEPFYDEFINRTYEITEPGSWVSVCTDWDYMKKYITESEKRNIRYRILLCESEAENPVMAEANFQKKFLGWDYAYATGDNYSAVYNEIPYVFPQFRLNENGLLDTEEEIKEYLAARKQFEETQPPYTLEYGDFVIFKLYELAEIPNWGKSTMPAEKEYGKCPK